ncbi:hypothetical protein [Microbacterium sp. KSW4-4]|uniref:hypothetical protein n=1 Tax=Microbacterium sp. KSW4-4 TaxID=2851651 RepID=UPI001FFD3CA5|nr:hypothetical protein [Microbacterium sp. KSW4-4]MCK2034452.1 hypothetical protein [Microbacterium sp. KSW4-4]
MDKFEASNGITVGTLADGRAEIVFPGPTTDFPVVVTWARADEMDALREFFQHERDEELGRWRWPENPDYVVYPYTFDSPRPGIRGVTVLAEEEPRLLTVWEDNIDTIYGHSNYEDVRSAAREAARAYFEAHPERKPWEDAKPGEVWVVAEHGQPERAYLVDDSQFYDSSRDYALNFDDSLITAARRIWPESD